jgi:hypothetical protein
MNHSTYESGADAEVSKALRHEVLKGLAERKRRSIAASIAVAASCLLVPWLELPRVPALVAGGSIALAIFAVFEVWNLKRHQARARSARKA